MRKFINSMFSTILSLIFFGLLIFGMTMIQVPIMYSFDAVAERIEDDYFAITLENQYLMLDLTLVERRMYIRFDENIIIVDNVEQHEGRFYFINHDITFLESYDQIHTFEIATRYMNLLEVVFLRGGRVVE